MARVALSSQHPHLFWSAPPVSDGLGALSSRSASSAKPSIIAWQQMQCSCLPNARARWPRALATLRARPPSSGDAGSTHGHVMIRRDGVCSLLTAPRCEKTMCVVMGMLFV